MNFITDNQFILYRFSGKAAKILHVFRSLYVGGIVVSFLIAFQVISLSRVLNIVFDFNEFISYTLCLTFLFLYATANSFKLQLKTDFLNAILFVLTLGAVWYFLSKESGGLSHSVQQIIQLRPEAIQVIPKNNIEFNKTLLIYFAIQWWSINLFDGGGPEMARFTSTKSIKAAVLAGLTPPILRIIVICIFVSLTLMSISISGFTENGEVNFLKTVFGILPKYWQIIVALGFFSLFITTSVSLLKWGSSFIVIDFYKGYIAGKTSNKRDVYASILCFIVLISVAYIIVLKQSSLNEIIKIVFSISAGVAPVYFLRWFWLRINAWSQLSAMISSGLYTLILYALEDIYPFLHAFEIKLILVTLLVTITWLVVTFLTPKDDEFTLSNFQSILPTKKEILKRCCAALAFGTFLLTLLFLILNWLIS